MITKHKTIVLSGISILAFIAGYISYVPDFPDKAIVPLKSTTLFSADPAEAPEDIPSVDDATLQRWAVYEDIEALGIPGKEGAALAKLKRMLVEDPVGTFEKLGALPERQPGEEFLVRPLIEYLLSTDMRQTASLLEMLNKNPFLYHIISVNVASTIANEPSREGELFQWWAEHSDNTQLADSTASAVLEIIRRNNSSAESIIHNFERTMALPTGPMRSKVLKEVLSASYPDQFEVAQELLLELPNSAEFDAAIGEFAYHASKHNPAISMDWAMGVTTEEPRRLAVVSIAHNWAEADHLSFRSWYAENNDVLDEETLNQIRDLVVINDEAIVVSP